MNTANSNPLSKVFETKSSAIWTLLLGVSSITLFFNTKVADPFNTPKLLLLILLGAWLMGHVINSIRIKKMNMPFHEKFLLSVTLLFLTTLIVSTVFSGVFYVSLIGDTQRRNGSLSYICLATIFIFTIQSFNQRYVNRFFVVSLATSLVISGYGLLQIFDADFVEWNNPYNSMISTLGNPNFASSMLAILGALSLFQIFIKNISILQKIASCISLLISLYCIIKSDSRQGLVAFATALIFYVTIYTYLNYKKYFLPVIGVSSFLVITGILGMLQTGPLANLLYKESVSIRGFYWRAAFKMFIQNPLTGVGTDRYGAYFRQFMDVEYTKRYGYEITSSNAHNTFLQFFSTSGVFAGVLYLIIQLLILSIALKHISKVNLEKQKIILAILSAWIAYQAQSLISIDNLGLAVWGWLLGGIAIAASYSLLNEPDNSFIKSKQINNKKVLLFQPILSLLILIFSIFPVLEISRSESQLYQARSYLAFKDSRYNNSVVLLSKKILTNNFADPNYKFEALGALFEVGDREQVLKGVEELHLSDPKNLSFIRGLIALNEFDKNYEKALKFRIEMLQLDPWNAPNYLQIIKLSKLIGNSNLADRYYNKLLEFASESDIAKSAKEELR